MQAEVVSWSIRRHTKGDLDMRGYRTWNIAKRVIVLVGVLIALLPSANADDVRTPPGPPLSSHFEVPLWSLVAPNGGSATVSDGHLILDLPGGSNHDTVLGINGAVRLLQPIANVNFDVAIKIELPSDAKDAREGLMLVTDDRTFLTWEVTRNENGVILSAHSVSEGVVTSIMDGGSVPMEKTSMYLRLQRQGDTYTAYSSMNNVAWTVAGTFVYVPVPAWIGPFAGNSVPSRVGPVVMSVDWFKVQQ